MEKATFGAGCFWGVEVAFGRIPGVTETAVGYEGGKLESPSYKDVCTDQTGHAEVVEVTFDPARGQLQDAALGFLFAARPDAVESPGTGLGHAVQECCLLPLTRAGSRSKGVDCGAEC